MTVTPVTGDQVVRADLPTALRSAAVTRLVSCWPVATLCQAMGVSRSGYYAWKDRLRRLTAENPRRLALDALGMPIQDCHARSRGTYGSHRIHADLVAHGMRCSRRGVARLPGVWPRRAVPAPDLVRRASPSAGSPAPITSGWPTPPPSEPVRAAASRRRHRTAIKPGRRLGGVRHPGCLGEREQVTPGPAPPATGNGLGTCPPFRPWQRIHRMGFPDSAATGRPPAWTAWSRRPSLQF